MTCQGKTAMQHQIAQEMDVFLAPFRVENFDSKTSAYKDKVFTEDKFKAWEQFARWLQGGRCERGSRKCEPGSRKCEEGSRKGEWQY